MNSGYVLNWNHSPGAPSSGAALLFFFFAAISVLATPHEGLDGATGTKAAAEDANSATARTEIFIFLLFSWGLGTK
jgi:hypothetical protein